MTYKGRDGTIIDGEQDASEILNQAVTALNNLFYLFDIHDVKPTDNLYTTLTQHVARSIRQNAIKEPIKRAKREIKKDIIVL